MYIIFVEHQSNGKRYLFDCSGLERTIKSGDSLICETMHGEQHGTALTNPIEVNAEDWELAVLFKLCGAYLPIKRILGKYRMQILSDAEKETIAKEWLRNKLGGNELPF